MLHFELCYYQGMEICFKEGLSLFEAGAQGEQKLKRGFLPTLIKSAHHLREPQLFNAVKNFIRQESEHLKEQIQYANELLPYSRID